MNYLDFHSRTWCDMDFNCARFFSATIRKMSQCWKDIHQRKISCYLSHGKLFKVTCEFFNCFVDIFYHISTTHSLVFLSGNSESHHQGSQRGNGGDSSRLGEVLLLSPGGVREAIFSDEYYSLLWGKRRGFARIAIKAKRVCPDSRFQFISYPD